LKKTVNQKLKDVCRNKGRLEQDLASANQTTKYCVELEISVLLQKLQDGHLSCLEVLRAYQAKVYFKNEFKGDKCIIYFNKCIMDSGSGNYN
jgi:hypothetical protein